MSKLSGFNVGSGVGSKMVRAYPSTQYSVIDYTEVPIGTATADDAGTLLFPMLSSKGIDNTVQFFKSSQIADFIEHFGAANIKKYGLMSQGAINWLIAGGTLAVCRLTLPAARYAGAIMNFKLTDGAGTSLYIGDDGLLETGGIELPLAATVDFKYETDVLPDADEISDFELEGLRMFEENNGQYPFLYAASRGRGKYGNAFSMSLTKTPIGEAYGADITDALPTYKMSILESGNLAEEHEVTFEQGVYDEGMSRSIEDVIENDSTNRVTMGRLDAVDDALLVKFGTAVDAILTDIEKVPTLVTAITDDEVTKEKYITRVYQALEDIDNKIKEGAFSIFGALDFMENKIVWNGEDLTPFFGTTDLSGLESVLFKNGIDYEAGKEMKTFDWDYEKVDANPGPVEKAFNDFFMGATTKDIYDHARVPVDVIMDMGYPTVVKQSIASLCVDQTGKRGDITYIMNAPVCTTLSQLRDWDNIAGIFSEGVYAFAETSDTVDVTSSRRLPNVPMTYLMLSTLRTWFSQGGSTAYGGLYVNGIMEKTVLPEIGPEDGTIYGDNRFNLVNKVNDGFIVYGQTAKIKKEGSSFKLPNRIMRGRLNREVHSILAKKRFAKTTAFGDIEKALVSGTRRYNNIFEKVTYECKFTSAQREANGILDVVVQVFLNGYIESFNVVYELRSSALES